MCDVIVGEIDIKNFLLDSCTFMNKHRWFFVKAFYSGARFAVLGVLLALCLTTCGTPKAQESKSPEESLKNSALAVSVAGDYRESKDPGGGVGFYDPHTNSWTKHQTRLSDLRN